jgi:hypothetical protein
VSEQPIQVSEFETNPPSPAAGNLRTPNDRRLRLAAWASASLATLLVLSELLAADTALAWSLGGMLELGRWETWLAAGIGAAISLWIAWRFFRAALAGEIGLIRNDENRADAAPAALA